jgi:hypothetical protein
LSDTLGKGAANPLRSNEQTTIAALTEVIDSYEFLVHAGDIAYADYWLKEEVQNYLPNTTTAEGAVVYEHILNAFYDELAGITSQKPYMVNAGNHDANCDNGGTSGFDESICLTGQTNFTCFINHWRMPSGPSGGLGNFWYSYDYGMVHFIHLDTETDLGNGLVGPDEGSPEFGGPFGTYNQQIDWLTADLAAVNRTVTPWIVAFGHRGWYLSASGSVCQNCQTAFEDLFYEYDVDLYVNGHAHLYERTAPIFNGAIDPNGLNNPSSTLYITNGAAGHYDGLDTFTAIQPYSVYREDSDYAWTTISFTNSTHLTVSTMWSANNTVLDSATLYKAHVYTNITRPIPTTTTTSSASPTSTMPFNGQGHLYVYTGGQVEGDIGSADTWYDTPGQNTATYTAVPVASNGSTFTLQHSSDFCAIGSDSSFGCTGSDASEASIFGQTPDGNLTYNGSPAFYASSAASSGAKPSIYVTSLPVSLNIVWGLTELIVTAPVTTSTDTLVTGTSSLPISTTSSAPFLSTTGPATFSNSTTSYIWSNSTIPIGSSTSITQISTSTTASSKTESSTSTPSKPEHTHKTKPVKPAHHSKSEKETVSTVYLTTTYIVTSYVPTVSSCPAAATVTVTGK